MPIRQMKFRIRVVVEREGSGFFAYCPDLQGVAVEGATREDLEANIQCAVQGHLESLLKHNDPIPLGVIESDETHDILPFICKKISDRLGLSKGSEYIQDVLFEQNLATA